MNIHFQKQAAAEKETSGRGRKRNVHAHVFSDDHAANARGDYLGSGEIEEQDY